MNRDDIIRMAREAGFREYLIQDSLSAELERFAALVAAHERDECAWIADSHGGPKEPMMVGDMEAGAYNAAEAIAADIRARRQA